MRNNGLVLILPSLTRKLSYKGFLCEIGSFGPLAVRLTKSSYIVEKRLTHRIVSCRIRVDNKSGLHN